ncbi:unnamed protein product [Pleuronectes platessa]|uniref:Uncharacterized protein n=1 Tax=Pleuronectes platessa TaxID=8262 RepID=A0A9N7UN60_PLEPL|nr:unnamed protein product [Pleuronectes platessa]
MSPPLPGSGFCVAHGYRQERRGLIVSGRGRRLREDPGSRQSFAAAQEITSSHSTWERFLLIFTAPPPGASQHPLLPQTCSSTSPPPSSPLTSFDIKGAATRLAVYPP